MANRHIFSKHIKSNIKLSTRYDAEGCEVQVEGREDLDATVKELETYDILIKAGYYRACIKGLPAFDKVVGGMTWCIECSNYDVDVDLLFHENLTIGQKIALVEKIVAILPQMKCPYLIEPHQIQGLEFLSIYRVIEWLVKTSVEYRAERILRLKKFATGQFHNNYQFKSDVIHLEKLHAASNTLERIQEIYYPLRNVHNNDRKEDADFAVGKKVSATKFGENREIHDDETQNSNVRNLPEKLCINQILLLKKDYEEIKRELETDVEELNEQNQLKTLKMEKKAIMKEIEQNEKNTELLLNGIQEKCNAVEHLLRQNKECESHLASYKLKEDEAEPELIKNLQSLLKQHDDLKREESNFKEQSQLDFNKLQQKIEKLEMFCAQEPEELKNQILEHKERIKILKLHLAKCNRAIVALERQLDNIPDRTELSQYQRRFHELHNEMSAKHLETKQYYTLYNTLSDTKRYMEKELSLLNSICATYNESKMNAHDNEQFVKQFEHVISEVKQTEAKVASKFNEEKVQYQTYKEELQMMLKLQRQYAATIKQLTKECQRCEMLQQYLESIGRKPIH